MCVKGFKDENNIIMRDDFADIFVSESIAREYTLSDVYTEA
jgi:hypothetical protein